MKKTDESDGSPTFFQGHRGFSHLSLGRRLVLVSNDWSFQLHGCSQQIVLRSPGIGDECHPAQNQAKTYIMQKAWTY